MKINKETSNINMSLYAVFSSIQLDIEGSNIDFAGWIPSDIDKKSMPIDIYESEKKKVKNKNQKFYLKM